MSSTGLMFRTAADVRAIPNQQWERWIETESVPFRAFASERRCQQVLRHVVKATRRRMA